MSGNEPVFPPLRPVNSAWRKGGEPEPASGGAARAKQERDAKSQHR